MSWGVQIVRKVWSEDPAAKEIHALIDRAEKAFVDVLKGHERTTGVSHGGTYAETIHTSHIAGHTEPTPADAPATEAPPSAAPEAPTAPAAPTS